MVQACSAGLSVKSTKIPHLETCSMQPRGLEGRAQHGHSSSAHSTPGDQCCGCQRDGQVVVWWWVNGGVQNRCTCIVNGIKWGNTQIQYVMRPSLDGTSSLYPLGSIWCECRGPAQRCWQSGNEKKNSCSNSEECSCG